MQKGDYLKAILRSKQTIFTVKDLVILWRDNNIGAIETRLNYYVSQGDLLRLRRGVYVTSKDYNQLELGTRIYNPSYISFETVLVKEGLIFQYYGKITLASYLNREIIVDGQNYQYRKIKQDALLEPIGIQQNEGVSIASKERAFLDIIYLNHDFYLDNPTALDKEKLYAILPIYKSKRMEEKIRQLI
jgi:hypothetical protein